MKNIKQKSKLIYKLTLPIALVIVLSILFIILLSRYYLVKSNSDNTDAIIQSKIIDLNGNIDRMGDKALYVASMASNLKFVKEGFKKFYETKNVDSAAAIFKPNLDPITQAVNSQTKSKAKIHYHVPPARSLYRSWTDKRGDDISGFRSTILQISRTHQAIEGIEIGRGGFVLRGISPVFDENKEYYGSTEVLLGLENFLKVSKTRDDEELAMFMHKDLLSIATGLTSNEVVGNFVLIDRTSEECKLSNITGDILEKGSQNVTLYENGNYKYGLYPIYDYSDEMVGVGCYQLDMSQFKKELRAMNIAIVGIGIVAIILLLVIVIGLIIRLIIKPVNNALELTQSIANGDLTNEIHISSYDEIGVLLQYMENMQTNLKEIVENIVGGANNIASASQQMSSSSQQMSQGASEQASSAEQVSSSMEEMAASIQHNTDNANTTEKISLKASKEVTKGNKVVLQTVESMKNIADKITIISEIARQTNILALNAAVEAARAGEHGKGFAVVAEEVRKLAARSQEAAKEIEETSRASVSIAEEAGKMLEIIVPDIEKTARLVQEISAANNEMSSGAEQVNSALQQLNNVTQQNAAASEELATSSEELSSQADELKSQVSFFKTGNKKK